MSHSFRTHRRPALRLAFAASITALLAACGGGGGGDSSSTDSSDSSSFSITQDQAQSSSSTSLSSGYTLSSTSEAVYANTTQIVRATRTAQATRRTAASVSTQNASEVIAFSVPCSSGGSADIEISGASTDTLLNGELDEGEHYAISFSACVTPGGAITLDGEVDMDVESVSTDSPASVTVALTFIALQATVDSGSATLDGVVKLNHTESTADETTTVTSQISSADLGLVTAWNSRSASLTLTDVEVTATTTWKGGVPVDSTLEGQYSLTGSTGEYEFADSVSITSGVSFDALGRPTSGTWASVGAKGTLTTTVADGKATVEIDSESDGTVDHTWTVTVPDWLSYAG